MDQMCINDTVESGNTKHSPKKEIQRKRYVFTLNNYTNTEYELIEAMFKVECSKWIIGKEIGENGTPHLQCFCRFKSNKRFSSIKKYCPRLHIEVCRGNDKVNYEYCSKEGDFISGGFPEPIKLITKLYNWEKECIDIVTTKPNDRDIWWFKGQGGVGKTSFCKYLVVKYNAIILGGKSSDMKHNICELFKNTEKLPELIIINLPKSFDSTYISYTGIEEVKDMCFFSGKYEGGMIVGNCPNVIIFSNEWPDVHKLSLDRWKLYNIDKDKYVNVKRLDEEVDTDSSDDE